LSRTPDDARSRDERVAVAVAEIPGESPVGSSADAASWLDLAEELRRFVLGVTRDADLTGDVLQNTFAKAVEQGHTVSPASRKAWLFRVAYNEAMLHHRRRAAGQRAIVRVAWDVETGASPADIGAVQREMIEDVRTALKELPAAQHEIVRRRIYEQQKFAEIAEELDLPLGTVLSRMQLALKKLRAALQRHGDDE
jgi:RNA polymerase sigma-70 factor (ECF subfamily)